MILDGCIFILLYISNSNVNTIINSNNLKLHNLWCLESGSCIVQRKQFIIFNWCVSLLVNSILNSFGCEVLVALKNYSCFFLGSTKIESCCKLYIHGFSSF